MLDIQYIQTSPEIVLLAAKQNKQIHLLDPKTMSILYKYTDDSFITKPIAYSHEYQQFLASQSIKTLINIWNTDTETPTLKISLPQKISYLQFEQTQSVLVGGTQNGTIFIWQIPSGLLLKKFMGHTKKIININITEDFFINTVTQTEVKIWKLINIFNQNNNNQVKADMVINLKQRIINTIITQRCIYILSQKYVHIHKLSTLEKQDSIQLQNATCFTSNQQRTHIYIGSKNKNIYEYRINKSYQYRQIDYKNQSLQFMKTPKQRTFVGHKHQITQIQYINSLKYLISSTVQGQLIVWSNGQVKHEMKLFRTQITVLKTIKRPNNFKGRQKKNNKIKIKALHKYEQNKQSQLLQINITQKIELPVQDQYRIFRNIIDTIYDQKHLLSTQIQQLKSQNQNLIKCAQHYAEVFLNKYDQS